MSNKYCKHSFINIVFNRKQCLRLTITAILDLRMISYNKSTFRMSLKKELPAANSNLNRATFFVRKELDFFYFMNMYYIYNIYYIFDMIWTYKIYIQLSPSKTICVPILIHQSRKKSSLFPVSKPSVPSANQFHVRCRVLVKQKTI